jgi:hypothetical protein
MSGHGAHSHCESFTQIHQSSSNDRNSCLHTKVADPSSKPFITKRTHNSDGRGRSGLEIHSNAGLITKYHFRRAVFSWSIWDTTPRRSPSLPHSEHNVIYTYGLIKLYTIYPENGGNVCLRNVGNTTHIHMV